MTADRRAALLRSRLEDSARLTSELCDILGSFEARMGRLEGAIGPVQDRARSLSLAAENLDKAREATAAVLVQFDVPRALEARLSAAVGDDIPGFLTDVDKLLDAAGWLEEEGASLRAAEPALRFAKELLARAMASADTKLRALLVPAPLPAGSVPPPTLPLLAADALVGATALIQAMEAVGFDGAHAAFVDVRGGGVAASLAKQGLAVVGPPSDLARAAAETVAERSAAACRCLRWAAAHAAAEAQLLSGVLSATDAAAAMVAILSKPMEALCAWVEALAAQQPTPERLMPLLDVHAAASAASPALSAALTGRAGERLAARLAAAAAACAAAAQTTFAEWAPALGREAPERRPAPADGGVHSQTAATVGALRRLFDDPAHFPVLLRGAGATSDDDEEVEEADPDDDAAAMGAAAARVLLAAHTAVEARARACRPPALGHLFLANNLHYIVTGVAKCAPLAAALGAQWGRRAGKAAEAAAQELAEALWGGALAEIADLEGLNPASLGTQQRERVKDKFRLFNEALEAAAAAAPHWAVADAGQRDALRRRVAAAALPAYGELYDNFAQSAFTKYPEKYVKHSPAEAQRLVGSFFAGLPKP